MGDENCLHLNVFTNDVHHKRDGSVYMKCKKRRPVMVYLYGGGFMWGSSGIEMYGPDYLMQKDIVFVSLNYRVGAFGNVCCRSLYSCPLKLLQISCVELT